MTSTCGLIPEQIWESAAIPERELAPGKPSGSAMPLVWAHSEFLKLLVSRAQGRPVEMLRAVEERYHGGGHKPETYHWRVDAPFDALPAGCDLLIEMAQPFVLRFGFDGWQGAADRPSEPLPFGRQGVRMRPAELTGHQAFDFTWRTGPQAWTGIDYRVALPA